MHSHGTIFDFISIIKTIPRLCGLHFMIYILVFRTEQTKTYFGVSILSNLHNVDTNHRTGTSINRRSSKKPGGTVHQGVLRPCNQVHSQGGDVGVSEVAFRVSSTPPGHRFLAGDREWCTARWGRVFPLCRASSVRCHHQQHVFPHCFWQW